MIMFCEMCGNEISSGSLRCKYCGTKQRRNETDKGIRFIHRTVNIESGMPIVDEALVKLEREITRAKQDRVAVVTIIHGYGSSGRGGAIREECRKTLEYLENTRYIRSFIAGEDFSRKMGKTRALLRRLPGLKDNDNLAKNNKGVTVVEL